MKYIVMIAIMVTGAVQAGNKIIFLISPPRSLSVACMRMFEARGDFAVVNEPSWPAYDLLFGERADIHSAYKMYQNVLYNVLGMSLSTHVLVKEISFAIEFFLMEEQLLFKNPDVHFVFLIRDPHASLVSFVKKRLPGIPLERFGYSSCCALFEKAKTDGANPPLIVISEELSKNPEKIVRVLSDKLGIDFKPESLHWDDLGDNFDGRKMWNDSKRKDMVHHWHDAAIHSTGFTPLSSYQVDAAGNPTFVEVPQESLADIIQIYSLIKPYYQFLMQETDYIVR